VISYDGIATIFFKKESGPRKGVRRAPQARLEIT